MHSRRFAFVLLVLTLVALSSRVVRVQNPPAPAPAAPMPPPTKLTGAPLTHLGIVCPDIEKCAKGYADIFGIAVPAVDKIKFELPNGKKVDAKVAYVPMPNFYIEILQPTTKSGPLWENLQKYGVGIHHLGVGIDADIDGVRTELESKGGKWTGGSKKNGTWAWADFRPTPMGVTLEVGPTARPAMPPAPTVQEGLFGARPISHVGFANTDASASVKMFVEVFGMKVNEPRRFPPTGFFPYPPNMWTTTGTVQTTILAQGPQGKTIGLEIIQGVGEPNPWSHHMQTHNRGVSAMHIAVGRGKYSREDWLRIGQEKGGKWTNGGPPPEGSFAYLDWADTLGLVIE